LLDILPLSVVINQHCVQSIMIYCLHTTAPHSPPEFSDFLYYTSQHKEPCEILTTPPEWSWISNPSAKLGWFPSTSCLQYSMWLTSITTTVLHIFIQLSPMAKQQLTNGHTVGGKWTFTRKLHLQGALSSV
jgi:hypothetical protein